MDISFQRIESRAINIIGVSILTESGCDPLKGEYSLVIENFIGCLDISSYGGVDDISLIKEAIENDLDFSVLPEEGYTQIILQEDGEWEDVFWHKYYKILRIQNNRGNKTSGIRTHTCGR